MDDDAIRTYITEHFPGTTVLEANGDSFYVHDPDRDLPPERQMPWATLVMSDVNDTASDLSRAGVFRLNIGLPKALFQDLFPTPTDVDHTALDVVMPHPVYGSLHWVCVLNPDTTWPAAADLLVRAHELAVRKYENAAARRT